ncbi:MAG TPA: PQQ-binding-like beta-propeller repeat protein [Pirellulaceae bacterium]|jgi:outer membrane protein assembly factor BamB
MEQKSAVLEHAQPPRRPGPIVTAIVAVAAIAIVGVRLIGKLEHQPRLLDDPAVRNLIMLICGFLAIASLWTWFCFRSGFSVAARRAAMIAPLAFVPLGFVWTLAIGPTHVIQFSGSMMPRIASRERPLQAIEATNSLVDLATTTPDDFPQFLGPQRNCWLPDHGLIPDWSANPPRQLWKRPIGAGWSGFAAVNGYAITMEQRGAEEAIVCYSIDTGEPVWGHTITARHEQAMGGIGPRSTPTIHNGRVYALGATGILQCLDGKNGKPLWSSDLRKRYATTAREDEEMVMWGRAASPLIVDSLVVVPGGGKARKNLVAFDMETGKVVWEAENQKDDGSLDQIGYTSPSLATLVGRRQIVIVNESTASGHDPETGTCLWSFPWPGHSNGDACNSQAAVVDDRHLLLSKGYSAGAELIEISENGADGEFVAKSVWKVPRVLQTKFSNVVIHNGHAYGLSEEILECVDLKSGKRKWKSGRYGHGQILGVGDLLLVLAEEGELNLVELNPTKFVSHGSIQALEGKTWNNLCLDGKRLLIRNAQEAACFELP